MKKDYPLKICKGNTAVTIYKNVIAAKDRYKVHYFDKDQRKSKAFTDPEVAEKDVNQMVENLKRNQSNPLVFSTTDRDECVTPVRYKAARPSWANWTAEACGAVQGCSCSDLQS
jgi:hypothetical protein